MNRLRVRVGERIIEQVIRPPDVDLMLWVEDEIDNVLDIELHFGPYRMEYLGKYAWDIFVDDRKVGHAKAWDEKGDKPEPESPSLFSTFLLTVFCYLALC